MNAFPRHVSRPRGTALVVVLIFVVLLTGLVLVFFTKSTAFRVLSQSGVSEFKVDTLGRSALELTVADMRQEIANGSTAVSIGDRKLYLPKTPADNVPRRSGNPALKSDGTDPIPNLVRRSVRSDTISPGGVPSRASAVSSLDPAKNRKYVSAARWNKHYLIPRDPAKFGGGNSANVGTDPIPEFVAPDWVFVTTKGPEVLTEGKTNVIGRYAYAIYDEGGLLDINAAGYPESTPLKKIDTTTTPNKVWGSGNKGGSTAADLTVLGLTQSEINQIVGWRTFASSQPGGTFPNLTFDEAQAKKYFDGSQPHPYAFLEASNAVSSSSGKTKSDQIFGSRQQLLKFRSLIGFSQDALQYLGTFSRDLDQPSFVPNPNRPKVQSSELNNKATYGTGNDAFDVDRETNPALDINPPFPQVLVQKSFTRPDGTTAQIGDPLVKRRFPLSRLARILRESTAEKDDSDPIYRDFGIYRSSQSDPWKYDHGDGNGILRLDKVAAAGREPDFFELLMAGINVGSLAKGAAVTDLDPKRAPVGFWTEAYTAENDQQNRDTMVNFQVLQIGANIIDQSDSDGYPFPIVFADNLDREVRGVESLPYIHRIRLRYAQGAKPAAGEISSFNQMGTLLAQPELWNPHGTLPPSVSPSDFRVRAVKTYSVMASKAQILYKGGTATQDYDVDPAGSELTFTSDGTEFSESRLLATQGVPVGTGLNGTSRIDTRVPSPGSPEKVMGLVLCDFERLKDGTLEAADAYLGLPAAASITFYLEYKDGSSYRVFDELTVRWTESVKFGINAYWGKYTDKVKYPGFVRTDPRSSRWGGMVTDVFYLMPAIDLAALKFPSSWASIGEPSYATKFTSPVDKGFVGANTSALPTYPNYDVPPNYESRYRGFPQGNWTQNTVREQKGFYGVPAKAYYNRDADGIARRAMGGYANDPASGGSFDNEMGLPMIKDNAGSRPIVLNRPFRSVAELGNTFRDTPWKNVDFAFPESGDSALLDIFSVGENENKEALTAGKVSLNTRQVPVLQALLAGAIVNDVSSTNPTLSKDDAKSIAEKLVARTTSEESGKGPLRNRAELVGRWKGIGTQPAVPTNADPDASYTGFSSDIGTVSGIKNTSVAFVQAQRDVAMRALGDAGTARTWNLMIDLIAQSGRFPTDGANINTFQVQGEKRFWLHVAIDRLTGEVLDQQLEVVTE